MLLVGLLLLLVRVSRHGGRGGECATVVVLLSALDPCLFGWVEVFSFQSVARSWVVRSPSCPGCDLSLALSLCAPSHARTHALPLSSLASSAACVSRSDHS